MEANKILSADVLDIIFDGKNKEYGAYQLRKAYKKRLTKALIITGGALLLVLAGTVLANIIDAGGKKKFDTLETQMAEIKAEEPPPPPPTPPPPPPTPPPPPEINQVKFTPPKIVDDKEVKPEEKIEEIKDDQVISTKTVESDNKVQVVQAPVEEKGTQVVEVKVADDENKIFTKVEVEAGYIGGDDAWRNYLRSTLNANTPVDNGASGGKYTVIVKFVVSKDGSLSDIGCENDPGFGMCEEAVRVIKKTKKWTPAIQNGRNVNAYRRQPSGGFFCK
jgi:periplasmic protein TonB